MISALTFARRFGYQDDNEERALIFLQVWGLMGKFEEVAHPGLPVAGYQPQSGAKIDLVNANKRAEEMVLRILDSLAQFDHIDKRWLAIGRTAIEQGFMAVNRAVFQPSRIEIE